MVRVLALACLHSDMYMHCMDCYLMIDIAIADKMGQTAASIPKKVSLSFTGLMRTITCNSNKLL